MEFRGELQRAAAEFGTPLTEEQAEQFSLYYDLLLEWNGKMNLTAITEPREVAAKHVVDSLSAFDGTLFREGVRVVDVGSGAGFPGLALKIYFPSMEIVLLDSLQKRVKFLETVVSALGLSGVSCVHGRAEEAARQKEYREQFDLAGGGAAFHIGGVHAAFRARRGLAAGAEGRAVRRGDGGGGAGGEDIGRRQTRGEGGEAAGARRRPGGGPHYEREADAEGVPEEIRHAGEETVGRRRENQGG